MKNQTTITTAALGNFIYRGEYETYLGEYMSGVLPANRDAADDEIGRVVAELYTVAFGGIFEDNDLSPMVILGLSMLALIIPSFTTSKLIRLQ